MAAARMQRWAVTLSTYSYSLQFKKSSDNAEADCLSSLPLDIVEDESTEESETFYSLCLETMSVTSRDIAHATRHDPLLSKVLDLTSTGWPSYITDKEMKPFFGRQTSGAYGASRVSDVWNEGSRTTKTPCFSA